MPLSRPAKLEGVRCAIARRLFCHHLWFFKLSVAVVPRSHPWRTLVESARNDLCDLTETTLRPRDVRTGVVQAEEGSGKEKKRLRMFETLLVSFLMYALLARVTELPAIVPLLPNGSTLF